MPSEEEFVALETVIISLCKKIRDDKGYRNRIEAYVSDHSEVEFSHSIFPNFIKKLYPEFSADLPDAGKT